MPTYLSAYNDNLFSSFLVAGVKDESGKKDLRKKAGEYLNRAEQIKELIKNQDG